MGWIRALILLCASTGIAAAQELPARHGRSTLQPGTPIERTISPGQSHSYQVTAEENTLVQITVEQRGIDVVVRVHHPGGRKVGEYDSPNGADGPEDVSFVTAAKVAYQIEVTPLSREPGSAGKYEIRLVEMRPATEQEIKESKGQEALKARGLALINELEGVISELRHPQSRIKAQMQAAQLLWDSDEKRAQKYVTDAIISFKELRAGFNPDNKEYTRKYYVITNLRYEIVQALTRRQPEMALSFIRSTPPLADPYGNQRDLATHEAALELEVANQLVQKDPKRTLEIARENLKTRFSSALTSTIQHLKQQNPEMAAELASEVANKLLSEKLLKNSDAASLVISLIQMSAPSHGNQGGDTNGSTKNTPLLSDQQRRDLLQKAMNEALAYKPVNPHSYSPERDYAWSLLHGLKALGGEVETVMNGSVAAVEKRIKEFPGFNAPQMEDFQQYQNAVNNTSLPLDDVIQTLSKAPKEQREQLFVQLANRAVNNGDIARARQIINDYVTTPYNRQQALYNLEMQEMYRSMSKGKVEDALRSVASLSDADERAQMLTQIASQIGPGYKRATALLFLDQARGLLPSSVQAQSQPQMQTLLEIAKAFSRYDSKRAFEIVDPLIDQFNEISAAARAMQGFGGEYFDDEELNLQNGNAVAGVATQLTAALATLGLSNFDQAKATADRIRLPEVRLRAYLDIAQQAIQPPR
ncbi:MAG TPA: hypothetical protein VFO99_18170 [Pyrinomonadaceae bacterium]|nr:hypothetical protein [Pyrinomonadaceae bacterium]